MIKSFRHKGLSELWSKDTTAKIDVRMHSRILKRLDALDRAKIPEDMDFPGFDFHPLNGFDPIRFSIHVNGPWCITFEMNDGDAYRVDFEQYH